MPASARLRPGSRRGFALALPLALALAPGSAFAQADAGTYRATGELNIRAAPSTEAAIIGIIPPSGRVAVSSCDAFGWCQIRYENIDGWAARQLLVRTGALPADAFSLRFGPPAAAADPTEGVQELVGRVTPGAPCAVLRTDDGRELAVIGNVPFDAATLLRLFGEEIATDACGTGTALAILHVRIDR